MNTKFKILALFVFSLTIFQIVFFQLNGDKVALSFEPHDADSMWVEPSSIAFSVANGSIGHRFNITLWLNITSDNIFAWQVALLYNRTQLRAVSAGFTGGTTSRFMEGHNTEASGPTIDTSFLGNGSVLASETCKAEDYIAAPHVDSLVWIEFEVILTPSEDEILTSKFDITTLYPERTWVYNSSLLKIPITTYDCEYLFLYGIPVIENVSRIPLTPDFSEDVIVSATIVDDIGIDVALLSYTADMAWHNVTMNRFDHIFNATIPAQPYGVTVEYMIYANDTDGNWAATDIYSYNVSDSMQPEIVSVEWKGTAPYPYVISDVIREGEAALIRANVSKPANASKVTEVFFSYRVDGSEWWNTSMTYNTILGLWMTVIPADGKFMLTGNTIIEFYLKASDEAENTVTSITYSFEVTALILGDINGDGRVDGADLIIVARNYGKGTL